MRKSAWLPFSRCLADDLQLACVQTRTDPDALQVNRRETLTPSSSGHTRPVAGGTCSISGYTLPSGVRIQTENRKNQSLVKRVRLPLRISLRSFCPCPTQTDTANPVAAVQRTSSESTQKLVKHETRITAEPLGLEQAMYRNYKLSSRTARPHSFLTTAQSYTFAFMFQKLAKYASKYRN